MTIVKSYRAVRYHPLNAIDPEVATFIHDANSAARAANGTKHEEISAPLKMFEAFCDLTGEQITVATLASPAIEEVLRDFAAAMAGDVLVKESAESREIKVRDLYQAWSFLPTLIPGAHRVTWSKSFFAPRSEVCSRLSAATDDQRWYWGGWPLVGNSKETLYLRLAQLARLRGRDYVERIYDKLERHVRANPSDLWSEWNHLFDYLTRQHACWPEKSFDTEEGVKAFMHNFTLAHFTRAKKIGNDPQSQLKRWSRFIKSVENSLCKTGVWSALTSPIKTPPPSTKHPSESKTKKNGSLVVQDKMLTTIPLHVSDSEAMELLFFQIKNDLRIVEDWANAQADDLVRRYRKRKALAANGRVIRDITGTVYKNYSLADLCATLDARASDVPIKYLCKVFEHQTGQAITSAELAHEYGYATTGSLFAHQCLLVLEHPVITTEFLRDFKLYNAFGHLTGFDEEARLLTGYKNRKPSDVREQVIELTDSTLERVREIIEITSDSRNHLRGNGNSTYRYLFLTTGTGFSEPKQAKVTIWNDSKFINNSALLPRLINEFRPHCSLSADEIVPFLKKIRLTNIRASKGVEVFIDTKSTEAMSKALGHEHYYPDLLSHYLPEALLAFVKARWIRIFQKSLVCLAMEDSPYLLRATKFHNMDELYVFLEKHRIPEVPSEAADPERKANAPKSGLKEAVLSIGTGFLAALLSLEAAVKASTDRHLVCGRAEYWSSIAEFIKLEIQKGTNRVLKKHLANAENLVDASEMQKLIHVPAHWV